MSDRLETITLSGLSHIEFCSNVDGDVQLVIVKGGPNANVYDYYGGFYGE